MSNPFAVSMVRMQIPAGMGRKMNVGGFEIEADSDGVIEVPKSEVAALEAHGLKRWVEPEAKPGQQGRVGQVTGR